VAAGASSRVLVAVAEDAETGSPTVAALRHQSRKIQRFAGGSLWAAPLFVTPPWSETISEPTTGDPESIAY
jgi:hypothetical protein